MIDDFNKEEQLQRDDSQGMSDSLNEDHPKSDDRQDGSIVESTEGDGVNTVPGQIGKDSEEINILEEETVKDESEVTNEEESYDRVKEDKRTLVFSKNEDVETHDIEVQSEQEIIERVYQYQEEAKQGGVEAKEIRKLIYYQTTNNHGRDYKDVVEQPNLRSERIPLRPFVIEKGSNLTLNENTLDSLVQKLLKQRILIIYSADESFMETVCYDIATKIQGKKKYKKLKKFLFWATDKDLDKGIEKDKNRNIRLTDFTDPNEKKEIPTLVKLVVSEETMLQSYHITSAEKQSSLKKSLKGNNLFLLVTIERDLMVKLKKSHKRFRTVTHFNLKEYSLFPFKELSYTKALFKDLFPDDHEELLPTIIRQQGEGSWGDGSEEALRDFLVDLKKKSPSAIREGIRERTQPGYKEKSEAKKSALPLNSELHKTVLFVAAFFPELMITDFKFLVEKLVGDKTRVVEVDSKYSEAENEASVIPRRETERLVDVWQKDKNKILKKCLITTRIRQDGRVCFCFETSEIEEYVIEELRKTPLFMIERFEELRGIIPYFAVGTSYLLVENLQKFIGYIAVYDEDEYVYRLLINVYISFIQKDDGIGKDQHGLSEEELSILKQFKNIERQFGFQRFLELIQHLLDQEEFIRRKVIGFLELLLERHLYKHLLIFIQEFCGTGQLKPLMWTKKILEKDNDLSTYPDLISFLKYDMRNWDEETASRLKRLFGWMPDSPIENRFTNRQIFASLCILEFGNPINMRFPIRLYGEYPYRFPILAPLSAEKDSTEYFTMLVTWLFNKHAPVVLERIETAAEKDEFEDNLMRTRAFILESWVLVIRGFGKEKYSEQSEVFVTTLVKVLIENLGTRGRSKLIMQLGKLASNYNEEVSGFMRRAQKKELTLLQLYKGKRETVLYLRSTL